MGLRQGANPNRVVGDMTVSGRLALGKIAAPAGILDVTGDGIVSGRLAVGKTTSPSSTLDIVGDVVVSAKLRVGSAAAPTQPLDVVGDAAVTGVLSIGSNPAQSGVIRLPNDQGIWARNAQNTGDVHVIRVNNSNEVLFTGTVDFGNQTIKGIYAARQWGNNWELTNGGNAYFLGNVGVGLSNPGHRLDVLGRSRIRQNSGSTGGTNSAGFWLYQNGPAADRAFVGMMSDDVVGFYGAAGAGWALQMNVVNGNLSLAGELYSGNGKWFRVVGSSGIYWESWGGGWQMFDGTWLRAYNGKSIYTAGGVQADSWVASAGMRCHRTPYGNNRHIEVGTVNLGTVIAGNGSTDVNVTFVDPFVGTTYPVATMRHSDNADVRNYTIAARSATTTGFAIGCVNKNGSNGTNVQATWWAEGAD